jgi:apolipoprotein N-acyltransferase
VTTRGRVGRGLVAVTAGLALAASYPRVDWDVLAWVALAPWLIVAVRRPPLSALGWGWLAGFAFFLALLRWLNYTFRTFSTIPWPLTWGPTALLSAYCALWFGAVAAAVAWIALRRGTGWALAATPFLWVAAEWGRGHLMGGFPWGQLGYSQWQRLAVIQVAELGGVYAVSFVLAIVNAALAACFALPLRRALGALALASAVVIGTVAFGAWRLGEPSPPPLARVAIMQPAIEQRQKWDESYTAELMGIYLGLTQSVGRGRAELIVWPETSTPTVLRRDPGLQRVLASLSGALGAALLIGSVDVEDGRPSVLRNTAFLVDEQGIRGRYDKMQLVPFGEYVPFPHVIGFIRGWAEFISEMQPGADPVVFPGPPAPFGVLICYEGIFPGLVREFAVRGARLMINMTNDAWFGVTSGPVQHLAMYPFRAVEHRTAIVRAANTGVSAFVAPSGRITHRLGLFVRGAMTEAVPLRERDTLYTRFGDWLAYLSLVVSGAALTAATWRRA